MSGYSSQEINPNEFVISAGSTPLYRIIRTKDYIIISKVDDEKEQFKMLAGVEQILGIAFDNLAKLH
jgi:hypothetical protein